MSEFLVQSEDGSVSGPLSASDLRRMASTGELTPDTLIQKAGGSGKWVPASAVRGLPFPSAAPTPSPRVPNAVAPVQRAVPPALQVPMQPIGTGIPTMPTRPPATAAAAAFGGSKPTAEDLKAGFAALKGMFPRILTDPIETIDQARRTLAPKVLITTAGMLYGALTILLILVIYMKIPSEIRGFIPMSFYTKIFILCCLPFVALAATNTGLRSIFKGGEQLSLGSDSLSAAVSLMPILLAFIVFLFFIDPSPRGLANFSQGLGQGEAGALFPLLLCAYATFVANLLIHSVSLRLIPVKASLIVFITPVQIATALFLTGQMAKAMFS